jgi:hypothetical protein
VDTAVLEQAALQHTDHLIELRAAASPAPTAPSAGGASVDAASVQQEVAVASDAPAPPPQFDLHPAVPPAPSRPVRVLVVGDSTALYVGHGLAVWSMTHPLHELLSVLWCQGCGFVLGGTITSFDAASFVARSNEIVGHDLPSSIAQVKPDEVVLMSTVDDVANRQWTAAEGPLTPDDPRFRQHLQDAYGAVTESILRLGVAHVTWIIPPVPTIDWKEPEMRERTRYELQHDVIRSVAAEHVSQVSAVDVDRWMNLTGHAAEPTWRPDGVHFTEKSAAMLADQFLGPTVVAKALGS